VAGAFINHCTKLLVNTDQLAKLLVNTDQLAKLPMNNLPTQLLVNGLLAYLISLIMLA